MANKSPRSRHVPIRGGTERREMRRDSLARPRKLMMVVPHGSASSSLMSAAPTRGVSARVTSHGHSTRGAQSVTGDQLQRSAARNRIDLA